MSSADLIGAFLRKSNLTNADLDGANLRGPEVTDKQPAWAKALKGATLPDGTVHG